jgi:hypothetical protein
MLRIGFCTTAMNRAWQLRETLPDALQVLEGTPHFLALCDYNSCDEIQEIVRRFEKQMRAGQLLYFRTTEPTSFHASRAKNAAHRLGVSGGAQVLFNLDADNFISRGILDETQEIFGRDEDACLHNWSGSWGDGSFGRIAMSAKSWVRLGGYDETFLAMGWQDSDLLLRARAISLHYVQVTSHLRTAIKHSMQDKLRHTSLAIDPRSPETSYRNANVTNSLLALSRPIMQSFGQQASVEGTINFETAAKI